MIVVTGLGQRVSSKCMRKTKINFQYFILPLIAFFHECRCAAFLNITFTFAVWCTELMALTQKFFDTEFNSFLLILHTIWMNIFWMNENPSYIDIRRITTAFFTLRTICGRKKSYSNVEMAAKWREENTIQDLHQGVCCRLNVAPKQLNLLNLSLCQHRCHAFKFFSLKSNEYLVIGCVPLVTEHCLNSIIDPMQLIKQQSNVLLNNERN